MWSSPGTHTVSYVLYSDCTGCEYFTESATYKVSPYNPVLIVPGFCGNTSDWDAFAQVLTNAQFDVDRLEYGNSDYSLRPAAYTNVLAAKLDAMDCDKVAVVGHSMGGLIAREYIRRQIAAGQPSKIAELVTLGTPHHGSDLIPWAMKTERALDAECSQFLPLHPPCRLSEWLNSMLGCLGSPYSRGALLDMIPGSPFLNGLNYGANTGSFDSAGSKGWDAHAEETGLVPGVYYATIGGTASFCDASLRDRVWGPGASYRSNDCTVATKSAIMTAAGVFRARDMDLPLSVPVIHARNLATLCSPSYYASTDLANKVATILASTPSNPPVGAPATGFARAADLAAPEDSLQTIPASVDSLLVGQIVNRTVPVPATSLLTITMVSIDADLVLQDPNGNWITVADTSFANGVSFLSTPDGEMKSFELQHPLAGSWGIRVDGTNSAAAQQYGCVVSFASPVDARLQPLSPVVYSGDSILIRGEVADSGALRTDVTWSCRVLAPDGSITGISLFDDGIHGDSLAGDGIYGGVVVPSAGAGSYEVLGSVVVPNRGEFVVGGDCELREHQDLVIDSSDINFSSNVVQVGDSVAISAVVHNYSPAPAPGVTVEFLDLPPGVRLFKTSVDIAAASTATVLAPWVVAAPDSHTILVEVSPFVLDESNYANNAASRAVVLGAVLGLEPSAPTAQPIRFAPPRPNPARGGVVFEFELPRIASASLRIFDVFGREVMEWRWSSLSPGSHQVSWDGRGESGVQMPAGLYLCRLQVEGKQFHHRLILRR